MPALRLDIIVLPTYNIYNMAIMDISQYPTEPPSVANPTLEVKPPGFDVVSLSFTPKGTLVIDSTSLGITVEGSETAIPDGIYHLKYMVDPSEDNYVEKSIMRVDKLQEKFDEVFMQLDLMECDGAIKKQAKVNLNSVYYFIQASIAAANNCANNKAYKLYEQANKMLNNMISNNCGCTGVNYVSNY